MVVPCCEAKSSRTEASISSTSISIFIDTPHFFLSAERGAR
jgi:hypothetical protein